MSPSRGTDSERSGITSDFSSFAAEQLLGDSSRNEPLFNVLDTTELTRQKATSLAACFLRDYESGRPPSFSGDISRISDVQIKCHQIGFSTWWRILFLYSATFCLFVSFFKTQFWTAVIHSYSILIFAIDLHLKQRIFGQAVTIDGKKKLEFYLHQVMYLFVAVTAIQSWMWVLWSNPDEHVSSLGFPLFKPLIFFYLSQRARDALQALFRISKILFRVIAIEMFLILIFAAVACRLYYSDDGFESLVESWLSLFQLSTTVVNPSLWMPLYSKDPINAVFFVIFIVVCVFYLHSLILSVVFQIFIQAATEVHERSSADKENSIRCAYQVLSSWQMVVQGSVELPGDLIRETLAKVRPHYGTIKLDILMELVDPDKTCPMGYSAFQKRLREALNSSVRSARKASMFTSGIDLLSVLVTIVNFLFVTLLTSRYQPEWFNASMVAVGSMITIFSMLELVVRCNIWSLSYYPMTRSNAIFDSFAAVGVFVSCYGICSYLGQGNQKALNYLYTGRAVDMIRSMRFFPMVRDVVDRSVDVLPALEGPVLLVCTTIHVFVCIGMLLWGGHVDVEELSGNEYLQAFYYLNNFNSYSRGLVTVFNVMVVNDWHEIARVFLYADRFSEPRFVYPYFVVVVLVAVCVMLNVITAFFVETFVTRLSKGDIENDGVIARQKSQAEFSIATPRRRSIMPGLSHREFSWSSLIGEEIEAVRPSPSSSPNATEVVRFNVFERQGFDRIMRTVGNISNDQDEIAKCILDTLNAVSSLVPHSQDIEYLVCCLPSLRQFPTTGFRAILSEFVSTDSLDSTINECVGQLTSTQPSEWLEQKYRHPSKLSHLLTVSVRWLPHVGGLILFVAKRDEVNRELL